MLRPVELAKFRIAVQEGAKEELIKTLLSLGYVHLEPYKFKPALALPELLRKVVEGKVTQANVDVGEALRVLERELGREDEGCKKMAKIVSEYEELTFLEELIQRLVELNVPPSALKVDETRLLSFLLFTGDEEAVKKFAHGLGSIKSIARIMKVRGRPLALVVVPFTSMDAVLELAKELKLEQYKLPEWAYTRSDDALKEIKRRKKWLREEAVELLHQVAERLSAAGRPEPIEAETLKRCLKASSELKKAALRIVRRALALELAKKLVEKEEAPTLAILKDKRILRCLDASATELLNLARSFEERDVHTLAVELEKALAELEHAKELSPEKVPTLEEEVRQLATKLRKALLAHYVEETLDLLWIAVKMPIDREVIELVEVLCGKRAHDISKLDVGRMLELCDLAEATVNELKSKGLKAYLEEVSCLEDLKRVSKPVGKLLYATKEVLLYEPYIEASLNAYSATRRLEVLADKGLCVIEGWVPKSYVKELREQVKRVPGVVYFKVRKVVRGEQAPVLLKHKGFFKHLSSLTLGRGVPNYWEVDPTPIFVFLFTAMYGIMFGDVGLGAIILAAGLFLLRASKPILGLSKESVRTLGALTLLCGASSIVFGTLYGIAFLKEVWHPILGSPIHDMWKIAAIALMFGAAQLVLGMLLNVTNSLLSGDYFRAVFSSTGMLGITYYLSGAYIAVRIVESGFDLSVALKPDVMPATAIAAGSLAVVALATMLRGLVKGHFEEVIHGIVEALEMIIAYPANSLSYIRLAAFAIAHEVFGLLAESLAHSVGALPSYLFANVITLVIEGFAVGIQALRLTYYEFSTKFFRGGGRLFKPLLKLENDAKLI